MKIIGHRGAAGIAPENTIASIEAAQKAGVDAIEFDVRITKDGNVVLCHDESLLRTFGVDKKVANLTLKEIRLIKDKSGEPVPTLSEALTACKKVPAILEAKGDGWAYPLAQALSKDNISQIHAVIAFNHRELFTFGQKCPSVKLYALEHHNAMEALTTARLFGFDGIDLNFWIMNPLVYLLAKRHQLDVCVYTLDWPWIAGIFRLLYPKIFITTNLPHKFRSFHSKKNLSS